MLTFGRYKSPCHTQTPTARPPLLKGEMKTLPLQDMLTRGIFVEYVDSINPGSCPHEPERKNLSVRPKFAH